MPKANPSSVSPAPSPLHDVGSDTPRPTLVRFRMVALATGIAVMLYLHRVCISPAGETIVEDLNIARDELDYVLGFFFWTYALAQLPAGWLGDRYGARWMLAAYLLLWSATTGLMALAPSLSVLLILRMSTGLFQAGAYPLAAGIVSRWIPVRSRGLASSFVAVGGRIGGALAPLLTVQLMLLWTWEADWFALPGDARAAASSWRPVMAVYGGLGCLLALVFVWLFRDRPEQHAGVNADELRLIREGDSAARSTPKAKNLPPPIKALVSSESMWMNCFVQFATNLGWALLVTKLPQYLSETFQTTQQDQGWMQSLPLAAGIIGLLLGGVFTDTATRLLGRRRGRSVALVISRLLTVAAFVALPYCDSAISATLLLSIVGFATDLGTPAIWAYGQDVGGEFVGSVVGWGNMWGNFGAAVSPMFFTFVITRAPQDSGWEYAFLACAAVNLLAAAAALRINAAVPLSRN
ncbi:MAG: MFS transporter [Planctomycetaceae bacterium]